MAEFNEVVKWVAAAYAMSTMNVGVFFLLPGLQQVAISFLKMAVRLRSDYEQVRFNLLGNR